MITTDVCYGLLPTFMIGVKRDNITVAVVSFAATEKGFVEEKWRRRRRFCTSAVPSEITRWLSSTSPHSLPLLSPTKKASRSGHLLLALGPSPNFFFSVLFYFALVGILRSWHHLDPLLPCRRPLSSPEPSHSTVVMSADGGRGRRGGGAWGVLAAAGYSTLRRAWALRVPVAGRTLLAVALFTEMELPTARDHSHDHVPLHGTHWYLHLDFFLCDI
ncbi:hypothetical protein BHE74_00041548 [Ensete ventricosum]|nr:hypothetical protein BHE74_00041548 [Ensete ventricosum]